ncbi:unnamed protein product [Cylindrotheca closterium]|uniref:Uncharacterized protein n=1 Tax=Cylindrotheca closterium TaxID=2856 RepID=A0AAD2CCW0_9STRA|nr:unnamed protein product [Cylindrotheca closterium]
MRSLPAGVQRWTTKHVVGMCGVGKFKVRWGYDTSAACPCCGEFEDHLHVPRCRAPSASAEWDRQTVALDLWLDTQVTDPAIKHALLSLLKGVCNPSLPSIRMVPGCLSSAFRSQQRIGYQGLLEGRLSRQWAPLQEEYLQSRGSQRSPTLWASRLSHQLILLGFQLWEHWNSVQHSEDNVQLQERSQQVNDGIHNQFAMGPTDLPKVVQRMLSVKRRTVLNKPLVDREEWLKLVRMERTAYHRALAPQRHYYGWVPDEIEVHGDEAALADALIQGRLRIISDGSYKNDLGTAAVQLLPKGGTACIVIRCQTPGLPQDQSAYRSNLICLLAGIIAVDWLLQQWFPALSQRPGVKITCDGLLAIEMAFEDQPLSPTDAQFDLISSIREAISRSPVSWSPRHVYGHLDKSNLFDELTWWEKKNLEVDGMAVDFRKKLEAAHQLFPPNPRFFTELAALFVADTKQSRLSDHFIQECVTLPRLRQHWRNRNVISEESENLIDWETLGRAMRSLPAGLQHWITKHWVGMCGMGKFKVYWGLELSAACPQCGEFEDHLHVPVVQQPRLGTNGTGG